MFFSFGSILFHVFCPNWHRNDDRTNEKIKNMTEQIYPGLLSDTVVLCGSALDKTHAGAAAAFETDLQTLTFANAVDKHRPNINTIFHTFIDVLNAKHPALRTAISVLMVVGIVLLAIPSLWLFGEVVAKVVADLSAGLMPQP